MKLVNSCKVNREKMKCERKKEKMNEEKKKDKERKNSALSIWPSWHCSVSVD